MITVHLESPAIRREFPHTLENCHFCRAPTGYWHDWHTPVCKGCAVTHNPEDLKRKKS